MSLWENLSRHREFMLNEPSASSGTPGDRAALDHEDATDESLPVPNDETDLIAASQAGDEAAFAILFERYQSGVLRHAMRLVQDQDEAAEIVQDVFLAAWQGLDQFRGDAKFTTWLHTITYRRALRTLESRQQYGNMLTRFAAERMDRLTEAWSAMQVAIAEQQWQLAIRDQIDALPAKYREVVSLRHLNELSYEEIAQRLTIPISSVKTHLFRARAMLRDQLQALDMATMQQNVRHLLPTIELPSIELPTIDLPAIELPTIELPAIDMSGFQQRAAALRDQMASNASGLGEILRGHLQNVSANLDALRESIGGTHLASDTTGS